MWVSRQVDFEARLASRQLGFQILAPFLCQVCFGKRRPPDTYGIGMRRFPFIDTCVRFVLGSSRPSLSWCATDTGNQVAATHIADIAKFGVYATYDVPRTHQHTNCFIV